MPTTQSFSFMMPTLATDGRLINNTSRTPNLTSGDSLVIQVSNPVVHLPETLVAHVIISALGNTANSSPFIQPATTRPLSYLRLVAHKPGNGQNTYTFTSDLLTYRSQQRSPARYELTLVIEPGDANGATLPDAWQWSEDPEFDTDGGQ